MELRKRPKAGDYIATATESLLYFFQEIVMIISILMAASVRVYRGGT
jgi:hypothetical protein